uniref:ATP-dependent DNA helicase n=2 Tax=Amphimedon queenslandica TaxID=400682 RepID=A0A1X7TFL1_AMPQE
MSALFDNILYGVDICPCYVGSTVAKQSFIGDDYYCESGNPDSYYQSGVMYPNDPLWDGKQCTSLESPCCTNPNLPWFHKTLPNSTSDFIEMRLCGNESPYAEDTPTNALSREQLPLKLAWAMSIHKSQGMTLDCVEISLGGVFETGQAYVVLLCAKSLKTLRVKGFDSSGVQVNKDVLEYYRNIRRIKRAAHCGPV